MSKDPGSRSPTALFPRRLRHWTNKVLDEVGDRLWNFDTSLEDLHLGGALPIEGDDPVEQAKLLCHKASSILLFTGSGISAASGIKTFRGGNLTTSLYADPIVARMTHATTFDTEAAAQLAWHQHWKQVIQASRPNRAHIALAALGRWRRVSAVTQNVDTLLEQAFWHTGQKLDVVHLHGSLEHVRCHDCPRTFGSPRFDFTQAPPCARCGGRLRPGVVWFGEVPSAQAMSRARRMFQHAQVCLVIGTSAQVAPASHLPLLAKEYGVRLIEVNPQVTPCSAACDVVIRGRAEDVLPRLTEDYATR